ncbi:MAG: vitamin B12-dependent ribonucleotide reductase [Abditibacteriota bacterium]|nr:vitamin B12-dependent ribonucleotide reductase [Abditibacteriota bacterium]
MKLSENALTVLEKRYLTKDENGDLKETPEGLFVRVCSAVAEAEKKFGKTDYEETKKAFLDMLTELDFLPNSPTLMNAGKELGQLSACFVLPVEDSMEDIFETIKNTALIHKSGGGTGFSFSRLRPASDIVRSTNGVSSGPVSFMEVFNSATEAIKQGGTRRGANMGCLRVDHPNILDFIKCKNDLTKFTNFNISVLLTEKFMEAVKADADYELINPRTGECVQTLSASRVFDLIVGMAWKNGEPGIIFIDRINRDNPTPAAGMIESTNPCGEQPLLPYEACNLGSINLAHMVKTENGAPQVDFEKLKKTAALAVRFLDDVIEINKYPIPEIEKQTLENRKIGLGIMGFADMLFQLNVPYDSPEACETAEQVMKCIRDTGREASARLAAERGVFPGYKGSIYDQKDTPVRNATVTTIAPTGTLSIIASCSGGCEPVFGISFFKRVLDNSKLFEVNPYFEKTARERGFYSEELMQKIAERGSVRGLDEVPEDVQRVFGTALDITPEWHIRMQAAFQKYTDNAVSKTVNFPQSATKDDVRQAFIYAYELGCKGCTIYRYGSRDAQVLNIGTDKKDGEKSEPNAVRARPDVTVGRTERISTGCGHLYVTINEDEKGAFEIFTQIGKAGGCASSQLEAISRLCSLALRSGVDITAIRKHLRGIRCPHPAWGKGGQVLSCADAIGIAIDHYLEYKNQKGEAAAPAEDAEAADKQIGACPDCGGEVDHESGCLVCRFCGWSKCG